VGNRPTLLAKNYIVCNADESGASHQETASSWNDPVPRIEGMISRTGHRRSPPEFSTSVEYERPKEILQEGIDRCYRDDLLGHDSRQRQPSTKSL
jgi:NADH:ubiquinone oxidoreductase subunit F (NADH-binding)